MASDPWTDWYEAYRRQRDDSARCEAALQRQVSLMARLIVAWTAVVCGAAAFATWYLFW